VLCVPCVRACVRECERACVRAFDFVGVRNTRKGISARRRKRNVNILVFPAASNPSINIRISLPLKRPFKKLPMAVQFRLLHPLAGNADVRAGVVRNAHTNWISYRTEPG
jgi:hypothetical protein